MVAVLHRVVVGRVVAWRAREKGGRAESLFDDWLLLEGVERRRVGENPLEGAPGVAASPAHADRVSWPARAAEWAAANASISGRYRCWLERTAGAAQGWRIEGG